MTKRTLIVCGMASEAARAPRHAMVVMSSESQTLLNQRLAQVDPSTVLQVVSFGLAGGINPALKPGDLVTNPAKIFNDSAQVAITPAQRAQQFAISKCDAVDMETAAAQAFAQKNGLIFEVVRAIADPATFTLPPAALVPLKSNGKPDLWTIFKLVAQQPSQIGALWALSQYENAAFKTLEEWSFG